MMLRKKRGGGAWRLLGARLRLRPGLALERILQRFGRRCGGPGHVVSLVGVVERVVASGVLP